MGQCAGTSSSSSSGSPSASSACTTRALPFTRHINWESRSNQVVTSSSSQAFRQIFSRDIFPILASYQTVVFNMKLISDSNSYQLIAMHCLQTREKSNLILKRLFTKEPCYFDSYKTTLTVPSLPKKLKLDNLSETKTKKQVFQKLRLVFQY